MTKDTKKEIEVMLERFYFVMWDRYVFNKESNEYSIYGWIDREKDNYKDFVELCYSPDLPQKDYKRWDFNTSSVLRHNQICEILKISDSNHCIRIEKTFDIENVIKLKK